MILAMLGVLVLDNRWAPYFPCLAVVAILVITLAAIEMASLLRSLPLQVHRSICVGGSLLVCGANWATSSPHGAAILPSLAVFVAVAMASLLWGAWAYQAPGDSLPAVLGHVFVIFYVGVLGAFLVRLRWLGAAPIDGALALALTIFTPKFCDIGAYFVGRSLGQHKMAPRLSPGKTWEGFAGGVVTALLLALLVTALGRYWGATILSPGRAVLFGLALGIVGPLGDLVESLIKRECGQKDASAHVPGFGGVLDIVDSVLFSGPVAYLLLCGVF